MSLPAKKKNSFHVMAYGLRDANAHGQTHRQTHREAQRNTDRHTERPRETPTDTPPEKEFHRPPMQTHIHTQRECADTYRQSVRELV
jgi:hypothetical protein